MPFTLSTLATFSYPVSSIKFLHSTGMGSIYLDSDESSPWGRQKENSSSGLLIHRAVSSLAERKHQETDHLLANQEGNALI